MIADEDRNDDEQDEDQRHAEYCRRAGTREGIGDPRQRHAAGEIDADAVDQRFCAERHQDRMHAGIGDQRSGR